ncbi:hypothetical protein A0O28_0054040 [Trichoderma guizhouense]|uniref:Amidase domain-containing protein n=1 Tax=Trichoderma guizhouense TaxID=1491466 RepID=A0A1T3C5L8_9HYPO|nr:hypothetical protein A0O28_0054040 [Trichoderma guizhouense]
MGDIDVLTTTASDLKDMLSKGLITSRAIVKAYLRQIKRHNSQGTVLNALIDVAPEEVLLRFADVLDAERAAGNLRGPYHGIPIVLKLLRCGLIVLAKANLSMPGGSSSGSAVSVAAGFTPWSIGAETDGSIQTPASRASLFALKPTIDMVSGDGVFKLTNAFDSLGGMAKTAQDLAALTEILFLTVPGSPLASKSLTTEFSSSLDGLRLGLVDVNDWILPPTMLEPDETYMQQRRDHWNHALNEFNRLGAKIVSPIDIKKPSEYTFQGKSSYQVIRYGGWKRIAADYLQNLVESKVRSLEDIVEFSKQNPDLEFSDVCPDQNSLIGALKYNIPASVVEDAVRDVRQAAGPETIDRALKEYGIDAIIAPTESEIHKIASFAGV